MVANQNRKVIIRKPNKASSSSPGPVKINKIVDVTNDSKPAAKPAAKRVVKVGRMTQANYKGKDLRTHMYTTPDMYIGSDKPVTSRVFLHDLEANRIDEFDFNHIPAVVQLYMEVVSNTSDGINRSRRLGWAGRENDEPYIVITVDNGWVTCRNYGVPIPIEIHEESGMYVPSFIFGTVFTSSNYNDEEQGEERHEGGRNGVGAKVTNVFSKEFNVRINDTDNGKYFEQTWTNNMLEPGEPSVTEALDEESFVEISYYLDFDRFKMAKSYSEDYVNLFRMAAINLSFTCKCPISFNDQIYNNQHIIEYAWYFFGDVVTEAMVHYELANPEEEEIKKRMCSLGFKVPTPVMKKGFEDRPIIPRVELLLIDPSFLEKKLVISFVNSLLTIDNGVHVDNVYDAIVPDITSKINEGKKRTTEAPDRLKGRAAMLAKIKAKKAKAKKSKSDKPKEPKKKITAANVKPHISMILNCRVVNPRFKSQDKSKLSSPEIKLNLTNEEINEIMRWKLMDLLTATLRAIQMTALTKTDGRKVRHIRLEKGLDANFAGSARSDECSLVITEGDSALGYFMRYLSALGPKSRDTWGGIPIRGKLLNVKKATPERIMKNKEIALIKKMLGLKEGVDYSLEENRAQLRYGRLVIMTDADSDGSHIKGLLINFFDEFYPSLIQSGFICDYRTKYLRMSKGKKTFIDFYTPDEFELWKTKNPDWESWKPSYYKGLGTSEKKDIKDDSKNPLFIDLSYDRKASDAINLAFGKTNADERKDWLEEWRETKRRPFIIRNMEIMTLTTFFNREFILYVLDSLERAIPRFADGLKRSQGQILWGVMHRWPKLSGEKLKVAQLAGAIASYVDYKHNEMCLAEAIKAMAKTFTGANNMPLLEPKGQFGERMFGGVDAASARYINTKPTEVTKYIFNMKDNKIFDFFEDSGKHSDPKYFLPIIPFALINGIQGVATAYSTNVMNYNPIEVIDWLLNWIDNLTGDTNDELVELIPWYRGFTGEIYLIEAKGHSSSPSKDGKGGKGKEEASAEDELEEEVVVGEQVDQGEADEEDEDEERLEPEDPDDPELDHDKYDEIAKGREQVIAATISKAEESNAKYNRVVIRGKFEIDKRGTITVTELPIGRWPINYYSFLEDLREIKEITDFSDNTTDDAISYTIKGMTKPTLLKLNLVRKFRLSNMVFLDEDGIPKKFNSVKEYMNAFCEFRLRKYEERMASEIKIMEDKLEELEYKSQFVRLVVDGTINVINRKQAAIIAQMAEYEIPDDIYDKTSLKGLSEDDIIKIDNEIIKLREELEEYRNTPAHDIWREELSKLRAVIYKDKTMRRTVPGRYGVPPRYQLDDDEE